MTETVLIVEDEPLIRGGLAALVVRMGHRALAADGLAAARTILEAEPVDCLFLDLRLSDGDGLQLLRELRARVGVGVPVIIGTAVPSGDYTITAMRDGAFDYLTKPFDLATVRATIERALSRRALADTIPLALEAQHWAGGPLIGHSAKMLALSKLVGRAAASDASVLITGETGTGKEVVARALHGFSARATGPFVPVNLAALPSTLLESELFGHERGAFTGANARRSGRLEAAAGGTLFLDELGDLDLALQTKLLRVLQDGRFERVGGTETLQTDARIVAATHRPVRPGTEGSRLRADLYYRLAVIEIEMPPLRERRSDVPLLAVHALRSTRARAVSEAAMERLCAYDWPGNVRELIHALQRAAALCSDEVVDVHDLPANLSSVGSEPRADSTLRQKLKAYERQVLIETLAAAPNRAEAARRLGIPRQQLYVKMREHGISSGRDSAPEDVE